ncbi:hypothetical protein P5673_007742 [Acropora cervicornis]|uniref:C2H2-type domain-containing protein n=1 Tax=Acropora cervicornis TaxID=6130 RepID=A0AAD9VAZ3_ACRCE|nr:hypothetical protein P5673_007742 [Acropora cervicornis]
MASTSSTDHLGSQIPSILAPEVVDKAKEDGFQQTIDLLQVDAEELSDEISHSVEELEGLKQYPCTCCSKVCISKGGLTRHTRSKHLTVESKTTTSKSKHESKKQIPTYVSEESVLTLIQEIGKYLKDEKIYPLKQDDEFTLKPTQSFLQDVNALLHKFYRKKDRDKFMKEFFGKMYGSWKYYFHSCNDHKAVFLMLVNLPERLLTTLQTEDSQVTSIQVENESLSPEELGPLAYVAGYVIQSLYQNSKKSKDADSPRNHEIQVLLLSIKVPTKENQSIPSLSRGGLWAHVQVSKECHFLCFENIVKLYATVRAFSFARDIVNKYKLLEKAHKTKALRKQLKVCKYFICL